MRHMSLCLPGYYGEMCSSAVPLQAGLAITFLRLSTRFLASSRVLSILTRTAVPTIAYGRSLRTEISTLTGRGGHTAHHCKVPQSETHKHTQT